MNRLKKKRGVADPWRGHPYNGWLVRGSSTAVPDRRTDGQDLVLPVSGDRGLGRGPRATKCRSA